MSASTAPSSLDFSSYIAERTRDFTGRGWVFDEFDRWLNSRGAPRYFMIVGEPGIGKTAIAARLSQQYDLAAIHFCITRQVDTVDPLNFVRSLSHQLTRLDGFATQILEDAGVHIDVHIDVQENYGEIIGVRIENLLVRFQSALTAFNRTVVTPLKQLYAKGFKQRLVILVDALDEAVLQPGSETIVDLLTQAQELPSQVRFVLTTRPEGGVLRHFEQLHLPYLLLNAERDENMQDVREYVRTQLKKAKLLHKWQAEYRKPAQVLINRVTKASHGNFLYLVFLLPALANGTQRLDALDALPKGLDGMYRELLHMRTVGKDTHAWRTIYRPLLAVLAAARSSLTMSQLAQFTKLDLQQVDDILLQLQQFLDPIQASQGCYQLYHQSIAEFLRNKERAQEFWIYLKPIHESIVSYYQGEATSWDQVAWSQTDDYGLLYLAAHLYALRDQEVFRRKLYWLICKPFLREKYRRFGSHRPFTEDVLIALQVADGEDPPNLVQEVRGNLVYATLVSLATNVAPEALAAMAQIGQLTHALDIVALMHDASKQIDAYGLIIEALRASKEIDKAIVTMVANRMLIAAMTIEDRFGKAVALGDVARALTEAGDRARAVTILNQALAVAETIKDSFYKILALSQVAKALAEAGEQTRAVTTMNQALALVKTSGRRVGTTSMDLVWVLSRVGQTEQALQIAQTFESPYHRALALGTVARSLAQGGEHVRLIDIVNRMIAVVPTLEDQHSKSVVLRDVAEFLARTGQVEQALKVVQTIEDSYFRPDALSEVALSLAEKGERARAVSIVGQAWAIAATIESPNTKIDALSEVASILIQLGERTPVTTIVKQMLVTAETLEDPKLKAHALGGVARKLARAGEQVHVTTIVRQVLMASEMLGEQYDKASALTAIAQVLARMGEYARGTAIVDQVLALGQTMTRFNKDLVLSEVAGVLALTREYTRAVAIANELLSVVATYEGQWRFAQNHKNQVLHTVAQVLVQSGRVGRALKVVRAMKNPADKALVLSEMAQTLAQRGQIGGALKVVSTVAKDSYSDKMSVLSEMAQTLAQAGQVDQALKVVNTVRNPHNRALMLGKVARVLALGGELTRAALLANQALLLAEKAGDLRIETLVRSEVAPILAQAGEHTRAQFIMDQLLLRAAIIEDPYTNALILAKVAQGLAWVGEFDRTLALMKQLQERAAADEDLDFKTFVLSEVTHQVIEALAGTGRVNLALKVAQTIADPIFKNEALHKVIPALARAGQLDLALETVQEINSPSYWDQAYTLSEIAPILAKAGRAGQLLKLVEMIESEGKVLWGGEGKVSMLSSVGQALTEAGQQKQAIDVLQMALAKARLSGRKSVFMVLRLCTATLLEIDQGQVLWPLYEAIQEVDGWWETQ